MTSMKANSKRRQGGLAAVEAVIVLPILLFLALAIGEFGHMLMLYTTLNKAQQDGARYLANEAILGETGNICLGDQGVSLNCVLFGDDNVPNNGNVLETKNLIIYGSIDGPFPDGPLLPADTNADLPMVVISEPVKGFVKIDVTYNFTPVFGDVLTTFGFGDGSFTLTYPLESTITMRAL